MTKFRMKHDTHLATTESAIMVMASHHSSAIRLLYIEVKNMRCQENLPPGLESCFPMLKYLLPSILLLTIFQNLLEGVSFYIIIVRQSYKVWSILHYHFLSLTISHLTSYFQFKLAITMMCYKLLVLKLVLQLIHVSAVTHFNKKCVS